MSRQAGGERAGAVEGWRFWIDRGGTFTDVVAQPPHGGLRTHKLLSEDPERYEDAAVEGVRRLLDLESDEPIPPELIAEVRMGTTVATNALLERAGTPTLYVTTRGFGDALRIGYQDRPDIFALDIRLPAPAYARVLEVDERVGADGQVVRPLDEEGARRGLEDARRAGLDACAVAFVHGYAHPEHERRVAELARAVGFTQVSASHDTSPLMKLVGRGETTVVDAYLSPILRRYVDGVAAQLGDVRLRFMQSHGGLTDAALFRGKDAVLSGPAGGVVGAVAVGRRAGFDRVIGFDMGGTSTDVSHYAGELERSYESVVGGVRLRSPMLRIHTVAAGGGSICAFEDGRYRVGPRSAGADPGPACYGKGGPLTVTDCNLITGKLRPAYFPHVFGADGAGALDEEAARGALAAVAASMRTAGVEPPPPEQLADDFIRVACEAMARAIKRISTQRGHDVTGHALCCFGGAAGQHACLVADALGMTRVLLHPLAGVLSAYGMGLADVRALRERSLETPLSGAEAPAVTTVLAELEAAALEELMRQGITAASARVERRSHVKYQGTDVSLPVPWAAPDEMGAAFLEFHQARYGFLMPGRELTLEAVAVEAIAVGTEVAGAGGGAGALPPGWGGPQVDALAPRETAGVFTGGRGHRAPVYLREDLRPAAVLEGPAIVCEPTSTTVVEPGWQAEALAGGELLLRRTSPPARPSADPCPGFTAAARGVQQPLHVHRRADGRHAGRHGGLGEHQGAARLQLRRLRRLRRARRERPSPPRPPGVDGGFGAGGARAAPRRPPTRRRLAAQLAVRRRHPPARPHRGHAGVPTERGRRRRTQASLLRRLPRPSRRRRRGHAGLHAAGQPDHRRGGRAHRGLPPRGGRAPAGGRGGGGAHLGRIPRARPPAEPRRPARPGGGQRARRGRARQDGR